jgi:hypothetical protein
MKKNLTLLKFFMVFILLAGFSVLNSSAQDYKNGVLQGTFHIKVAPSLGGEIEITKTSKQLRTGIKSIDNLNTTYSVSNMKKLFTPIPGAESRFIKHGLHLWYEITVGSKASI